MHIPYQVVLIIHEERVNELLGNKREDHDNGLAIGWKQFWSNLHDSMQEFSAPNLNQAAPRRNHRTTQELAMVSEK